MIGLFASTLGGAGPMTPSGSFGTLSATAPATATSNVVTLTWTGGGSRNVELGYAGINDLEARVNGGAYANYTVPFSISSGDTVQIRLNTPTSSEVGSLDVNDATLVALVNTVTIAID